MIDIQNALLLLRFKFTDQSKADKNTCNGLLKEESDFHSRRLSPNCCLHAIMKNLYHLQKNSIVEKREYLGSRFFLVGKRGTSLKNGILVTLI
jgi:hypothetical protein